MASSAISLLSGIAAAAAGFAGEKVPKTGIIPGLDLATIIPALLGNKVGGSGVVGKIAAAAAKSGLLNATNLAKLAELAGGLISSSGKAGIKTTAKEGVAGLAAKIAGGTGSAANLASIATMAAKLAKPAKDDKALVGIASELGKALSSKCGVSFGGTATLVNALSKTLEKDTKSQIFTSILKSLSK